MSQVLNQGVGLFLAWVGRGLRQVGAPAGVPSQRLHVELELARGDRLCRLRLHAQAVPAEGQDRHRGQGAPLSLLHSST